MSEERSKLGIEDGRSGRREHANPPLPDDAGGSSRPVKAAWPASVMALAGAWPDFPSAQELRAADADGLRRAGH